MKNLADLADMCPTMLGSTGSTHYTGRPSILWPSLRFGVTPTPPPPLSEGRWQVTSNRARLGCASKMSRAQNRTTKGSALDQVRQNTLPIWVYYLSMVIGDNGEIFPASYRKWAFIWFGCCFHVIVGLLFAVCGAAVINCNISVPLAI